MHLLCSFSGLRLPSIQTMTWLIIGLLVLIAAGTSTSAVVAVMFYRRLIGVNLKHVDFELRQRRRERSRPRAMPYGTS
jgi:hypothetical protein